MKNAILGGIGGVIVIFMVATLISIFEIGSRQNELDNHVPRIIEDTLESYYGTAATQREIQTHLERQLSACISSDSDVTITLDACDMTRGILSVKVKSNFSYPGGKRGCVEIKRTAIVDKVK